MYLLSLFISLGAALFEFFGRGKLAVIIPYGTIIPVLSLLPRIFLAASGKFKNSVTPEWFARMEQIIFVIITLNVLGSLFLHDLGIQYDRFLHFVLAFLSPIVFLMFLLPFLKDKSGKPGFKVLAAVFTLPFAGLFLWEGLQFFLDAVFGSRLFYDASQSIKTDFWEDILFGFAGLLAGFWYVKAYFQKFLTLLRRDLTG